MPDPRFGEIVVAIVQAEGEDDLDVTELREWCRSRLAGYKTPKRFFVVDSLRRSAAGKADYSYLRDLAAGLAASEP